MSRHRLDQTISKLPPVKWPKPKPLQIIFPARGKDAFEQSVPDFRRWLWAAQKGICPWCHGKMKRSEANLDHVRPRARGGTHWLGNLLMMHVRCNTEKADTPPSKELLDTLRVVNARIASAMSAGQPASAVPQGDAQTTPPNPSPNEAGE